MRKRVLAVLGDFAEELILVSALVVLTFALWPLVGRVSLVIPSLVIVWLALPSRRPFVDRSVVEDGLRRRAK